MGKVLQLQGFSSRDRDCKKKKPSHGLGGYHRLESGSDVDLLLPPVIRLRPGDKAKKKCKKSPCPVSKIHQAMARAPGIVARKIKGACSKVLGHGGSYLTDLFASNQLLMHFTAAPVSMHRKRQMNPTVGFRAAATRSGNHSLIDR